MKGNARQQNHREIPVKKIFEPLVKKEFSCKIIVVFLKKWNELNLKAIPHKFIIVFRKKRGIRSLNLRKTPFYQRIKQFFMKIFWQFC